MKLRYKIISIALLAFTLLAAYAVYPGTAGTRTFDSVTVHTFFSDFTNVHLISHGDNHLLIDAGLGNHQQDLEAFLHSRDLLPADLSALIVTHSHHDHAGTVAYFQEHHGVKVIGGQADLHYFESGINDSLCPTSWLAKARHSIDQGGTFKTFVPDILVADQLDLTQLTGIPAQVFNVPGHTPGSLIIKINDIVFVGDLFRGGILDKSSAAVHFYQCDLPTVHLGTKKLLEQLAPAAQTFFPSHLGPVTRASVEEMLVRLGDQ